MTEEIWRDIPGYEGYYMVSNYGRVYSMTRTVTPHNRKGWTIGGKIMKPYPHRDRYMFVDLHKNGQKAAKSIHYLVMLAFVGPYPDGHEINHIDFDRTNNRLDNLEYVTPKQNNAHSAARRLEAVARGEANGYSKLTANDVQEIRRLYATGSYTHKQLGDMFGISKSNTGCIIRREAWKHI